MKDGDTPVWQMCSEDRWWIRAQEKTLWHNIAIWNDTHGEVAMKYLRKGSQAYVEGQIETRSWENDWQKHYATEVVLRPFNSELLLLNKAERPAAQPAQRRERGEGARLLDRKSVFDVF